MVIARCQLIRRAELRRLTRGALLMLIGSAAAVVAMGQSNSPVQSRNPDAGGAAPATQPAPGTGTVGGRLRSAADPPVSDVVVFLEFVDPARKAAPPSTPVLISQRGARFSPALSVVCIGQTVEFANDEDRPVDHNVFSQSKPKSFDLGVFRPGTSRAVLFDQPGPVRLHCSIHRDMEGMIYVAPTPYWAILRADGTYFVPNVPPGEYTMKTWQRKPRLKDAAIRVTVRDGTATTQDLELTLP